MLVKKISVPNTEVLHTSFPPSLPPPLTTGGPRPGEPHPSKGAAGEADEEHRHRPLRLCQQRRATRYVLPSLPPSLPRSFSSPTSLLLTPTPTPPSSLQAASPLSTSSPPSAPGTWKAPNPRYAPPSLPSFIHASLPSSYSLSHPPPLPSSLFLQVCNCVGAAPDLVMICVKSGDYRPPSQKVRCRGLPPSLPPS